MHACTRLGSKTIAEIRSGRLGEHYDRVYPTCTAWTDRIFPLDNRRMWQNNNEYCWNAARATR